MQEKDVILKRLGQHIKQLRLKHKITLENLCYKNGLEPSTVSRIEKGLVEPKLLTLIKLAEAFKLPIGELLNIEYHK